MDVSEFCRQSKVVIVIGKGGVGKTTVTATLARTAAAAGLDVLVVALDDSGGLPFLLGTDEPFRYTDTVIEAGRASGESERVPGRIRGRILTADAALLEYLSGHGLGRVSRRLVHTGALDVVATAIPGVREMLMLARLKRLELDNVADLIVLDAPASGHAVSFLTSSGGLADAARGGPLRSQAEQVVAMLGDPERCQVMLVTLAEETPVNEAVETAFRLEDEVGMMLGPVIVNAVFPVLAGLLTDPVEAASAAGVARPSTADAARLAGAAHFRARRQQLQREQIARLASDLPLPRIELPYIFRAGIGASDVAGLADALAAGIRALP
jgi:anion-transporting  ArsA/GET3 family ATPase